MYTFAASSISGFFKIEKDSVLVGIFPIQQTLLRKGTGFIKITCEDFTLRVRVADVEGVPDLAGVLTAIVTAMGG